MREYILPVILLTVIGGAFVECFYHPKDDQTRLEAYCQREHNKGISIDIEKCVNDLEYLKAHHQKKWTLYGSQQQLIDGIEYSNSYSEKWVGTRDLGKPIESVSNLEKLSLKNIDIDRSRLQRSKEELKKMKEFTSKAYLFSGSLEKDCRFDEQDAPFCIQLFRKPEFMQNKLKAEATDIVRLMREIKDQIPIRRFGFGSRELDALRSCGSSIDLVFYCDGEFLISSEVVNRRYGVYFIEFYLEAYKIERRNPDDIVKYWKNKEIEYVESLFSEHHE